MSRKADNANAIIRDIFTMIGVLILLCGLVIGAGQVKRAACAAEG